MTMISELRKEISKFDRSKKKSKALVKKTEAAILTITRAKRLVATVRIPTKVYLAYVAKNPGRTITQVQMHFGVSRAAAAGAMRRLRKSEMVVAHSDKPNVHNHPKKYFAL